jgi:tRNA G18 (ribose-2'-O)-methylase SpoU
LIHAITSADDPRLVRYRRVGDATWLRANDLFVAEGRLVVERLVEIGVYAIESVLLTPAAHAALGDRITAAHDVYVAAQDIVNAITGFNFHRGCLALVRRPAEKSLATFGAARRLIVLEGVGNPDNVGGVFRTAAAFAVDGVVLDPAAGDPLYRKAVRTSMGAVLRVPFARASAWPDDLQTLRRMGFAIVALTPDGSLTIDEYAARLTPASRLALLAGAEGPGLNAASLAQADVTVRIPIDARSDSLNVVVAVSIGIFHLQVRS